MACKSTLIHHHNSHYDIKFHSINMCLNLAYNYSFPYEHISTHWVWDKCISFSNPFSLIEMLILIQISKVGPNDPVKNKTVLVRMKLLNQSFVIRSVALQFLSYILRTEQKLSKSDRVHLHMSHWNMGYLRVLYLALITMYITPLFIYFLLKHIYKG